LRSLFLDTGFLIALEAADDSQHQIAVSHWREITESKPLPQLITTSFILSEVATFFNSRKRHAKAVEIGERLLNSSSVRFLFIEEETIHKAWRYFVQHEDKTYSLADCVSFVLMEDLGLREALAFDRHFAQAGFARTPLGEKA
jgi:predicted nucleic acid-binding protein